MTDLYNFMDRIVDEFGRVSQSSGMEQAEGHIDTLFAEMTKHNVRIADFTPAMLRETVMLAWLDGYTAGVVKGQASGQKPLKELFRDVMRQQEGRT